MTTKDNKLECLLEKVRKDILQGRLKPDWKGNYFSGRVLNDLREIIELGGFEKAFIFLKGKKDKKTLNKYERIKIDTEIKIWEKDFRKL